FLHADPYPHTRLALIVIGQEDGALVSRNAGKSLARAPSQFEAKSVQVVDDAGVHVLDAKDRHRGTEVVGCGFRHDLSCKENTSTRAEPIAQPPAPRQIAPRRTSGRRLLCNERGVTAQAKAPSILLSQR